MAVVEDPPSWAGGSSAGNSEKWGGQSAGNGEMALKGGVSNNNNNKISKKQFGKVLPQVLEDAEKM